MQELKDEQGKKQKPVCDFGAFEEELHKRIMGLERELLKSFLVGTLMRRQFLLMALSIDVPHEALDDIRQLLVRLR